MAGPRQDRDLPKVKLTKDSLSEFKFLFKFLQPHKKYFFGGKLLFAARSRNRKRHSKQDQKLFLETR